MKSKKLTRLRGFTLLETVIAIGVLAVLLTGFMVVFAPAADGIRKSINVQEADRLASTLETELVTLRSNEASASFATGFDKAYQMIGDSMKTSPELIFLYQYRGDLAKIRDDGTPEPFLGNGGTPGKDYTLTSMARRRVKLATSGSGSDPYFEQDLKAVEGRVYGVKAKQLVFSNGELIASTKQVIEDPTPSPGDPPLTGTSASGTYPEAVIAFSAEFYSLSSTSYSYLKVGGAFDPKKLKTAIFTRNLAVRR